MAILIIILAIIWFFVAPYIVMLNVNDIASYLAVGTDAPYWPFFWILLVAIISIGGGVTASKS